MPAVALPASPATQTLPASETALRGDSVERFPRGSRVPSSLPAAIAAETTEGAELAEPNLSDREFRNVVADLKMRGACIGPDLLIVADSQRVFAQLLAEKLLGVQICRRALLAGSIRDVQEAVADRQPCLIVTDFRLADGGALRLAEELDRIRHPAKIVVLSQYVPEFVRERLRSIGIAGILDKSMGLDALLQQLHRVACGAQLPINIGSNSESGRLGVPGHRAGSAEESAFAAIQQLSTRQYEVLLLLAEGWSVKLVAEQLEVSVKTVDSLKYRLMKMLNFHDRVELTRFAVREGLIDP